MTPADLSAWTARIHRRIDDQLIAAGEAPIFAPAPPGTFAARAAAAKAVAPELAQLRKHPPRRVENPARDPFPPLYHGKLGRKFYPPLPIGSRQVDREPNRKVINMLHITDKGRARLAQGATE
jgi:hypothetical protein